MSSERDLFGAELARGATGILREFNDAGVLGPADVHVALRLAELAGEDDPTVALAVALAVRGPRLGHVLVDLATIRETVAVDAEFEGDLGALPWPKPERWLRALADSELVADEDGSPESTKPLRLVGEALYLDRYWLQEVQLAADIRRFAGAAVERVDEAVLRDGLDRHFADGSDSLQALAAAGAVLNRFSVVAGGPGTGKTTTVSRIIALVCEQAAAAAARAPLVALAAPTGKAAARLEESTRGAVAGIDSDPEIRDLIAGLGASTVHRLLGWRPGSRSRFRHHRHNRLPHDLVIVDEASMVSLSQMENIVGSVRPDARIVLIGDPGQLRSVEAGAVLGDIVGPTVEGLRMSTGARDRLDRIMPEPVEATTAAAGVRVGDGIVVLTRVHRYGAGIGALADAIRRGDADAALAQLSDPPAEIEWIDADAGAAPDDPRLRPVRDAVVEAARRLVEAGAAGEASEAIEALGRFRLLCGHRRGSYGVANWSARIDGWLGEEIESFASGGAWYVGRPLLITANDYGLRLYNGDIGVVVRREESVVAAFERGGQVLEVSTSRLEAVQTAYTMTIHKSQGSQFEHAAVLLPPPASRILTRELLYTAVTRAQARLTLVATADAIKAAVERPAARASGLRGRLWKSNAQARTAP